MRRVGRKCWRTMRVSDEVWNIIVDVQNRSVQAGYGRPTKDEVIRRMMGSRRPGGFSGLLMRARNDG